ncbi:unnamed protein product [Polarella glacialis]|uniref:Uncharacterized protein n=1 Tax=Polarella glacialis TaxID=89957 RepID=A0A813FWR1_POLGL|nr:unnamed protein product [Polarella glacialis]
MVLLCFVLCVVVFLFCSGLLAFCCIVVWLNVFIVLACCASVVLFHFYQTSGLPNKNSCFTSLRNKAFKNEVTFQVSPFLCCCWCCCCDCCCCDCCCCRC